MTDDYIGRDQIGLRKPTNSTPLVVSQVQNVAFHHPGMSVIIDVSGDIGFRRACSAIRGWQTFHMVTRGWSDIAYQVAIDQEGRKYTLRGINIKSGANGNQDVNERFGAVLLILGPGEKPSAKMDRAAAEVQQDFRDKYSRVPKRPTKHSAVRPAGTECPGKEASQAIDAGRFDAISTPTAPSVPPVELDDDWEGIMALFNTKAEFEESVAKGVETGAGRYLARFLKNEEGSGDTILDDTKAHREAELEVLTEIRDAVKAPTP